LPSPFFAFIVEAIGYKTGDPRYDRLAHEIHEALFRSLLASPRPSDGG
jgi:hypothetical protein